MNTVKVTQFYNHKRIIKDVGQWRAYIENKLQQSRGLCPHEKPLR